jgi:hypothetical protein
VVGVAGPFDLSNSKLHVEAVTTPASGIDALLVSQGARIGFMSGLAVNSEAFHLCCKRPHDRAEPVPAVRCPRELLR